MKILLCVAGMPYAEAAISLGGAIAGVTQSPVTLLHVIQEEKDRANGERALAAAREMLPGSAVEAHIRQGDSIGMILVEVKRGNYDLAIIGARRETGLTQQLLGSVAQKITRRVPTSVLVAREIGPSLKRILICTGGIAVADPVIDTGAWLAGAARAQATLLHVSSPVPSMYTGLQNICETLPELLQTDTPIARHLRHGAEILAQHQVTAELKLCHGVADDEILREAYQGSYDLIVIGASGKTGRLKEWLLGNVTRQIVERAPCSVLVVKTELPYE
ncbi:MAG: universal stress protein [Chloroflexi bacterium]|nr:universal stress protein [Chloroflexota bacterium]